MSNKYVYFNYPFVNETRMNIFIFDL